jgi:hypothetical protein
MSDKLQDLRTSIKSCSWNHLEELLCEYDFSVMDKREIYDIFFIVSLYHKYVRSWHSIFEVALNRMKELGAEDMMEYVYLGRFFYEFEADVCASEHLCDNKKFKVYRNIDTGKIMISEQGGPWAEIERCP